MLSGVRAFEVTRTTVVVNDPAEVVTSPVKAGKLAAANAPVSPLTAEIAPTPPEETITPEPITPEAIEAAGGFGPNAVTEDELMPMIGAADATLFDPVIAKALVTVSDPT